MASIGLMNGLRIANEGNDKTGWVLASVSGFACVLGSCIICIDLFTPCIPRYKGFNIRKDRTFLAASMSLSFGVMIFSSLYGILPEANLYLVQGGKSPQTAKFMSIGFFIVGVVGLAIISEILHRCLPSSIVQCEHSALSEHKHHLHSLDDEGSGIEDEFDHHHGHTHDDDSHSQRHIANSGRTPISADSHTLGEVVLVPNEDTPLLHNSNSRGSSLKARFSESVQSLVIGKVMCTGDGTCYGYSESKPCDKMCLAHIQATRKRNSLGGGEHSHSVELLLPTSNEHTATDLEAGTIVEETAPPEVTRQKMTGSVHSLEYAGHHHVPKNEFLSIGLQTSLAIALHKIPEGFITFATNHANPRLGFAVFLAIFIHNITEGFAMSLPLFLAFKSRFQAILWASILGGLSQPAGALFASFWLKGAVKSDPESRSRDVVYGILFATTAGIMANVALQLYGQAVTTYHHQRLPQIFAFMGMSILGVSFAMSES